MHFSFEGKNFKKKQILKELEGLKNSVEKTAGIKERKKVGI